MMTNEHLTPEQQTLARQANSLSGTIESHRWKIAKLAYDAERKGIPAWAEVIGNCPNVRRSPSTLYEYRRAWALRKSVGYSYKLSLSFYVSAANRLSAGADDNEILDWLRVCSDTKDITIESARSQLPKAPGRERDDPPTAMVLPVWSLNDETIKRLQASGAGAHVLILPAWDDDYKSAKVAPVKEAVNA